MALMVLDFYCKLLTVALRVVCVQADNPVSNARKDGLVIGID